MSKLKLKAGLIEMEFDYEFRDGTEATFRFVEAPSCPKDDDADKRSPGEDFGDTYARVLKKRLKGDEELIDKMLTEVHGDGEGNIFRFHKQLEKAMGKHIESL